MSTKSAFVVVLASVAVAFLGSGCVSSGLKTEVDKEYEAQNNGFVTWWKDRANDLFDMTSVDVQAGRGFAVNVRPTEYLQLGIGWNDAYALGWRQRSAGWWEVHKVERGASAFYWMEVERKAHWGTKSLFGQDYEYVGWDIWEDHSNKACEHDWSDLGASLMFFVVGADVNVSLVGIADFVTGWFPLLFIPDLLGYHAPMFDISADDTYSRLKADMIKERGIGEETR